MTFAVGQPDSSDDAEHVDDEHRDVRRRRWWWGVALLVLLGMAGSGMIVGRQVQSTRQAASDAAPPTASWVTTPVARRVLAQTVIMRGLVRPSASFSIGVPSSVEGTPVVTGVNVEAGDQVAEGARVLEISGRPVFVLQGAVPVYRSLRPGMSGADVKQLQAAMQRLGCESAEDGDLFGAATKRCVTQLYAAAGYEPVPTSATDTADILTAQQAVADADAAVASAWVALEVAAEGPSDTAVLQADTALAAARRGVSEAIAARDAAVDDAQMAADAAEAYLKGMRDIPDAPLDEVRAAEEAAATALSAVDAAQRTGNSAVATANDGVTVAQSMRDALDEPPDTATEDLAVTQALTSRDREQAALDTVIATTGPTVAQGEVVFAPTLPARVQQASLATGAIGSGEGGSATPDAATSLVTLAAGALVVDTRIRPDDGGLVRLGMPVALLDEQSNAAFGATVQQIADETNVGADGQLGYAAVLLPTDPVPDNLVGVNMRVTVTAAATAEPVLVVPLAAVSSAADGSTSVQVVSPGASVEVEPVLVGVVAGVSADGFVAVEPVDGAELLEGQLVVVGR